jgi:hypothetical protein
MKLVFGFGVGFLLGSLLMAGVGMKAVKQEQAKQVDAVNSARIQGCTALLQRIVPPQVAESFQCVLRNGKLYVHTDLNPDNDQQIEE